jgi:hypothetical protein
MRLLTVFIFLLIACNNLNAATEVDKYDILLFGDKIGSLTATHETMPDGSESYTLDSHSKATILWIDKEVTSHLAAVYKDGKLISSVYREIEDGKLKRWYNVSWNGSSYTADGYKGKMNFTQAPTHSVANLFFENFNSVNKIFDEAESVFCDMSHPEPGTWEFKGGNGSRNIYHAVNGRVQSAEYHVTLATVKMVRVN